APKFSLRVPHPSCSEQRSRLRSSRKRRQTQNLFVPLKAFGRMSPDQLKVLEPPRDVGRFGRTTALDEPCQRPTIVLEIVAHAIQPFDLRCSDKPLGGARGFTRAIARQGFQRLV